MILREPRVTLLRALTASPEGARAPAGFTCGASSSVLPPAAGRQAYLQRDDGLRLQAEIQAVAAELERLSVPFPIGPVAPVRAVAPVIA